MNRLQLLILLLVVVFFVLLPFSRRAAVGYGRSVVLLAVGTLMLLPFAWLICAAFKDATVLNEYTFLPPPSEISPETVNLNNFRKLLAERDTVQGPVSFWRYVWNSLFLASAGTFVSMVFSSMGGYALAKYRFRWRMPVLTFMLASMTIPGVVLLAPSFDLMYRFGWMDSYKALLVPGAVSVLGIFLFRQAMMAVPDELLEAGRMDGCGEFRIYLQLVMPLVRPMTGAFCLISFLAAWNAFVTPNIYLQSQRNLTLPVVLNQYITQFRQEYGLFLAGTLLAIVPPAVLFLALQREFVSELTSGAIKQ